MCSETGSHGSERGSGGNAVSPLGDASVGRFISSDPAKAGDNWYAYCNNSPLNRTDPLGLDPPQGKPVSWELGKGPNGEEGSYPIYKDGSKGPFQPNNPTPTQGPINGHDRGRNVRARGGEEHNRAPRPPDGQRRGGPRRYIDWDRMWRDFQQGLSNAGHYDFSGDPGGGSEVTFPIAAGAAGAGAIFVLGFPEIEITAGGGIIIKAITDGFPVNAFP